MASESTDTRRINRLTVMIVMLIALVPMGTFALLSPQLRHETSAAIQRALSNAAYRNRSGGSVRAEKRAHEKLLADKEQRLLEIMQEKRKVRLQIAALRRAIDEFNEEHGIDVSDPDRAVVVLDEEKENLRSFIRYLHTQQIERNSVGPELGGVVVRRVLFASLGDRVDLDLRDKALEEARTRLLTLVIDAQELPLTLKALEERHEELLEEYQMVLNERGEVIQKVKLTEAQLQQIKRTVAEVNAQIMRMQADLARIDGRLQRRAERKLIEKGLLSPKSGEHSRGEIVGSASFSWPVYGRISAGFLEPSYPRYFGVPHYGIDIVTPQGTPIRAAADGIVFLARNGGMGYSYVLVGHRNGYATLYGHLSQISVGAGQELRRGQVLGYSGGIPGTPGAGLMTTGAHLHFEAIRNGVHLNPFKFLP